MGTEPKGLVVEIAQGGTWDPEAGLPSLGLACARRDLNIKPQRRVGPVGSAPKLGMLKTPNLFWFEIPSCPGEKGSREDTSIGI